MEGFLSHGMMGARSIINPIFKFTIKMEANLDRKLDYFLLSDPRIDILSDGKIVQNFYFVSTYWIRMEHRVNQIFI